jgi:ribonuclease HII
MLRSYFIDNCMEAGTDEAGRGCLAGPVTAAAVILPENFSNNLLNDSKLLTEKKKVRFETYYYKTGNIVFSHSY